MSKKWRFAVIGVGTVGQTHLRVLSSQPQTELVAVCDIDRERAGNMLSKHGISGVNIYTDQAEMHAKEALDAVSIATPSGAHLSPALLAMQKGLHVIVEKPVEIHLDRIERMIAEANRRNVRLAYISQNRWNDANRALKEAAEEGRFGRIAWAGCFTPWYRPDKYYDEGGWRGTWNMDGGGATINQSVHAIDLLQWIAGPVKSVTAFGSSRIHARIETEDTLSATLLFESGAFGTIVGTTAMFPGSPVRIEIGGENGTGVSESGLKTFKFRDERPTDKQLQDRINDESKHQVRGAQSNTDIGLQLHTKNILSILDAWDHGRDAETSGVEGRKSVAIVTALYDSMRQQGMPVNVV